VSINLPICSNSFDFNFVITYVALIKPMLNYIIMEFDGGFEVVIIGRYGCQWKIGVLSCG